MGAGQTDARVLSFEFFFGSPFRKTFYCSLRTRPPPPLPFPPLPALIDPPFFLPARAAGGEMSSAPSGAPSSVDPKAPALVAVTAAVTAAVPQLPAPEAIDEDDEFEEFKEESA